MFSSISTRQTAQSDKQIAKVNENKAQNKYTKKFNNLPKEIIQQKLIKLTIYVEHFTATPRGAASFSVGGQISSVINGGGFKRRSRYTRNTHLIIIQNPFKH